MELAMKNNWQVQDAKAKFSEFLNACLSHGPQIVTRRGEEAAVLVPIEVWNQMKNGARPTLKSWLLASGPKADMDIPPRGKAKRRPVIDL
jgi:prevent-host-death family protein